MSVFSGLFKSRDKPQNRTAGSAYTFFMGGTTSGKTVTERSAMQMTAVYSCVRILSEAVAGLPLHLYKYTDNGGNNRNKNAVSKIGLNTKLCKNSDIPVKNPFRRKSKPSGIFLKGGEKNPEDGINRNKQDKGHNKVASSSCQNMQSTALFR